MEKMMEFRFKGRLMRVIEHEKTSFCPFLFGQQQGARARRSRPIPFSGRASRPSSGPSFPGESAEGASRPPLAPRPLNKARGSQGGGSPAGYIHQTSPPPPRKNEHKQQLVFYTKPLFKVLFFTVAYFIGGSLLKQITVRLSDSDYTIFRRIKGLLDEKKDATALRLLISRFHDLHSIVDSLKKESLENRVAIRYLEKRNAELIENNLSSMEK